VSGSESTSGIVFYILAALVGMAVGFVTVWSQIRNQSRQAKADVDTLKVELEKRVRDYLNLKLDNIDMRFQHLKEDINRLERKLNNHQQKEDSFS
jgi:Tfp pilus assembly protein PilO